MDLTDLIASDAIIGSLKAVSKKQAIQAIAEKAAELRDIGWRVLTVWECALKGKTALPMPDVVDRVSRWLHTEEPCAEIADHELAVAKAQGKAS